MEQNSPDLETAYAFLDANFRNPPSEWRQVEIYVVVTHMETHIGFFHAIHPWVEGTLRGMGPGSTSGQQLRALVESGGGYLELLYDNPTVEGDEETGSPKILYVSLLMMAVEPFMLASGSYPEN